MSFYSIRNAGGVVSPGRITGDVACGLIERVCLEVKKVYDACIQQERLENVSICVDKICPKIPPVGDLTFISCRSKGSKGKMRDLDIQRIPGRPNFARVKVCIIIPLEVVFEDSRGTEFIGFSTITVCKDVILFVPDESIIPFGVDNIVSAICVTGSWVEGRMFVITICVTIILKIEAEVNLLVPAYGFCPIPPCEEFAENVCDEFFALPNLNKRYNLNCILNIDVFVLIYGYTGHKNACNSIFFIFIEGIPKSPRLT